MVIGWSVVALVHELIELGAVLGKPQTLQEFLELALSVFEPAQRLSAITVESTIATRWLTPPVPSDTVAHNNTETNLMAFRPGQSGNPYGRTRGARNRATVAAERLLDGEADTLTRKAIDLAKQGDTTALRPCMERILPARKDRPVQFHMPRIETVSDSVKAAAAIASEVTDGELTPMEAAELSKVVDGYTRAVETADLAARLVRLEQAQKK